MKLIFVKLSLILTLFAGINTAEAAWRGYSLGDVNLRSGPSVRYRVKTVVPRGAELLVLRCRGSWCNVEWRRWNGWMSARLIGESFYRPDTTYYDDDDYYDEPYYDGLIYSVPRVYRYKKRKKKYRKYHYKKKKKKSRYKKRKRSRKKADKPRRKKRYSSKKRRKVSKRRKDIKRSKVKRRRSKSSRKQKTCKPPRCKR